jgi:hypothetical protein
MTKPKRIRKVSSNTNYFARPSRTAGIRGES